MVGLYIFFLIVTNWLIATRLERFEEQKATNDKQESRETLDSMENVESSSFYVSEIPVRASNPVIHDTVFCDSIWVLC